MMNEKAQIWIETVIYTLIGLVIIGVILAIATPAINNYKDEILIEQTITALNEFNNKIEEVKDGGVGNSRIVGFRIKKGSLLLDVLNEKIIYTLEESKLEYSEVNEVIKQGKIEIRTIERGKKFDISLIITHDSNEIDLIYNDQEIDKTFNQASIPYNLYIENNGTDADGRKQINIKEL